MPTVDVTVSGASANSYITVAEGDTLADERLNTTAWDDAGSVDDQSRAVIMATARLDQESFRGTRWKSTQALKWPRASLTDDSGNSLAFDELPAFLKDATFELALAMLGEDILADSGLAQFDSVKVGPLAIDVRHAPTGALVPQARRLLAPWLAGSPSSPRIVRG